MNISVSGEDIILNRNKYYIVIDALYCDNIKSKLHDLDPADIEEEIRRKVFPDATNIYARFLNMRDSFTVKSIVDGYTEEDDPLYFCSDSGLLVFIAADISWNLLLLVTMTGLQMLLFQSKRITGQCLKQDIPQVISV